MFGKFEGLRPMPPTPFASGVCIGAGCKAAGCKAAGLQAAGLRAAGVKAARVAPQAAGLQCRPQGLPYRLQGELEQFAQRGGNAVLLHFEIQNSLRLSRASVWTVCNERNLDTFAKRFGWFLFASHPALTAMDPPPDRPPGLWFSDPPSSRRRRRDPGEDNRWMSNQGMPLVSEEVWETRLRGDRGSSCVCIRIYSGEGLFFKRSPDLPRRIIAGRPADILRGRSGLETS